MPGYGTFESQYEQSLAVLDTETGTLTDFPDSRTTVKAKQTLYSGLAFSRDGKHIYASMASLTDPAGDGKEAVGSGDCGVRLHRREDCAGAHDTDARGATGSGKEDQAARRETTGDKGVPYPAAIAVTGAAGSEKLLVADNLSDFVLLLDAGSGAIEKRFDLSESDAVPSTYPIALAVSRTASAHLSRCGTHRRLWNSIWKVGRWGGSWIC
jgi:hypothetical protein